uniref:Uncharacterized protein n=1 Tax=viral metagenome TaxID=1070528 RepID=A0A6M3KKD4_9ZZZZ
MNVSPEGIPYVQTRVRQPLGLIEVIDRSPAAVEEHPEAVFVRAQGGRLIYRGDVDDLQGPTVQGGVRSLYTRVWMGLVPPNKREPAYCCVVGEEYEAHLPKNDRISAHLRPVWLLDEAHDMLVPRLLSRAASLKDLYLPYIDRFDLSGNLRRTDPDFRLLVWPEAELMEDILKPHYNLCVPPAAEDVNDSECRRRWPYWQARDHVVPPTMPPYKEDPERLHAIMDALMAPEMKTPDGREMFGHLPHCQVWSQGQWQTPHLCVAMVVAALQRYDWSERIDPELADEDYAAPLEEEEEEERRAMAQYTEQEEAELYMALGPAHMALIESHGLDNYRKMMSGEQAMPPGEVWLP